MGERRPPLPSVLARWPAAMAYELLQLPAVMADARQLVHDLTRLTHQLTETTERLGELVTTIEAFGLDSFRDRADMLLTGLENTVGRGERAVEDALRQVASIESSTTELRNAFFSIIGRVPGARKRVAEAVPTARTNVEPEVAGTEEDPRP